jgi:hypothetical protein
MKNPKFQGVELKQSPGVNFYSGRVGGVSVDLWQGMYGDWFTECEITRRRAPHATASLALRSLLSQIRKLHTAAGKVLAAGKKAGQVKLPNVDPVTALLALLILSLLGTFAWALSKTVKPYVPHIPRAEGKGLCADTTFNAASESGSSSTVCPWPEQTLTLEKDVDNDAWIVCRCPRDGGAR